MSVAHGAEVVGYVMEADGTWSAQGDTTVLVVAHRFLPVHG